MSSKTCTVPNCFSTHKSKGLCAAHYKSAQRQGAFDSPDRPTCKMTGCQAAMRFKGLCGRHYQIEARADMKRALNSCAVKPCEGGNYREGHCQEHYLERYPKTQTRIPDCRRPGCTQPQHRLEACEKHWKVYQRNELRKTIIPCIVIGCQELATKKGQCEAHSTENKCLEPDCQNKVRSMGRCQLHYNQFKSAKDFPEDFWAFVKEELKLA